MTTHRNSTKNTFFSDGYLTKKGVRTFIGEDFPISSSTLRSWIKHLDFPKPIYITHKTPVWEKAKVVDWFKSRSASKDSEISHEEE